MLSPMSEQEKNKTAHLDCRKTRDFRPARVTNLDREIDTFCF